MAGGSLVRNSLGLEIEFPAIPIRMAVKLAAKSKELGVGRAGVEPATLGLKVRRWSFYFVTAHPI